ncbi:MAG: peptidase C11 [Ruminococcaceae bacterium]|nr:peptidase C11 [Oscillospiraceae bacterium]
MAPIRPTGRKKNITGQGKDIKRRGEGLGTGPVGTQDRVPAGSQPSGGRATRTTRGGMSKIIILLLVALLGGGGGLGSLLLGGGDVEATIPTQQVQHTTVAPQTTAAQLPTIDLSSLFGTLSGGNVSTGWDNEDNTSSLDTSVAKNARDKYTTIKGKGKDEVTLMVYLCGTDLESRSKMATSDLQEMINADISDKVNLIVYTGGCNRWQNDVLSSKTNQIWQVRDDGMVCLEKDMGNKSMTNPDTLSSFIKWCKKNYPANRNALIFWDHGGGSVSGFGYDEKFASSGSMSLAGIDKALTAGGVKFDFVGFDACLMATTENALMLTKHADYMIASEETEPGIGWYYTDWLTKLSENTSMSTIEIGKNIIDGFVETCNQKCKGQSTTLSIVDLAEAEATIPAVLGDFSQNTYELIKNEQYAQVSKARSGSREFGSSSRIDQVDLVHLAKNMNTEEGDALAKALLSTVKYNRTSSNMTNSYGLSIYFPLRKASMVDEAVDTYELIGMDEEYVRCIKAFASMEVSGQAASGGTASPLPSLFEMLGTAGGSAGSSDMIGQLLGSFLGGNVSSVAGLTGGNTNFLSGRALGDDEMAEYLTDNSFDGSLLQWENGAITLPEEQWELVQSLHANMFYDDGEGYIDLGTDNVFEIDEYGNLLAPTEITWIAVNEQPVAYYHESTVSSGDDYSITGYIPVLYNGDRAELVVEFTDENEYGEVVGVRRVYKNGETATVAKTMDAVADGDVIDFVCDYYSYDGEYLDSYMLGEQLIVDGELMISDVYVDEENANLTYLFTDIYNQQYWTTPVQ